MKYTIMKCQCCGKTFISEYWEGGYIDHVVNFVGNRRVYINKNDANDMAREIIFDGNNVRDVRYIKELLKCFMTWDCFSQEFKERVKQIVDAMVEGLKKAQKRVRQIEKKESSLVLALLREEDIDDAFFDLFDECCGGKT